MWLARMMSHVKGDVATCFGDRVPFLKPLKGHGHWLLPCGVSPKLAENVWIKEPSHDYPMMALSLRGNR